MNRKGKASTFFLIILLILFSFAMLGAGTFLWISYDKEKKHSMQLTTQLSVLREEKDKIQTLLEDTNKEKIKLEKKIKDHEDTLGKLNEKLASETEAKLTLRKEREELLNKIIELNSENENFKIQLEEKNMELAQREDDLQKMIAQQEKLKQSTAAVSDSVATEEEVSSSEEKLEPIVVSPTVVSEEVEVAKTAANAFSTNVLLVNREHAFLIIDAGKSNGVKIGEIFDVFHNNEFIGNVEIEKVHDTLSAANFLANFKAELATTSDVAKRTTK